MTTPMAATSWRAQLRYSPMRVSAALKRCPPVGGEATRGGPLQPDAHADGCPELASPAPVLANESVRRLEALLGVLRPHLEHREVRLGGLILRCIGHGGRAIYHRQHRPPTPAIHACTCSSP